jgi:ribosomal protein S18 acetylase RimI-like enzyme
VAVEPSGRADGEFYIERLAVVPEHRRRGRGSKLLSHALAVIREHGGARASIGIMNQNEQLKRWYEAKGFVESGRKRFAHLPFEVCFLAKELVSPQEPVSTDVLSPTEKPPPGED